MGTPMHIALNSNYKRSISTRRSLNSVVKLFLDVLSVTLIYMINVYLVHVCRHPWHLSSMSNWNVLTRLVVKMRLYFHLRVIIQSHAQLHVLCWLSFYMFTCINKYFEFWVLSFETTNLVKHCQMAPFRQFDQLGSVYHPVSMVSAMWDAHVLDIG